MSIGFNSQTLSPRQLVMNMKIQFDCRHFQDIDPTEYVLSSSQLVRPFRYNQTLNYFDSIVDLQGQVSFTSVQLTPFRLQIPVSKPPDAPPLPVPFGLGLSDMYFSLFNEVIDGLNQFILRIGAEHTAIGGGTLPDFIFATLTLTGYNNLLGE